MEFTPTLTREQAVTQTLIVALGLATLSLLLMPYIDLTDGLKYARLNFYTVEDDKHLGMQEAERLEAHNQIVHDPALNAYLQQLGGKVAAVVGAPEFQFQFRILAAEEINAMAFPGGPIYVNLGLLLNSQNEGELAGVLAHEIGHVVARHGSKKLSREQLVQGAIAAASTLVFGPAAATPLTGLITDLGALSFNRWEEEQADDLAVGYLYSAGYHPETMATFFDRLWQSREESRMGLFLSSHPLSASRAARVRWYFSSWPLDARWIRDSASFPEVKAFSRSALHVMHGAALFRSGKPSEAHDELDKAIQLNPANGEAYVVLAFIRAKINREDLALKDLEKAMASNPDMIEPYEALDAIFSGKKDWDKIIQYWTRFIDAHPANGKAYLERGGSYARKGDQTSALRDAQQSCNLGYQPGCQIYKKFGGTGG